MSELLQEYTAIVTGPDDTTYTVRSYGEERADGTWIGVFTERGIGDAARQALRARLETFAQ